MIMAILIVLNHVDNLKIIREICIVIIIQIKYIFNISDLNELYV